MTPEQLETGLLALERLRGEIDDAVLDLAQSALRERIQLLHSNDVPEQRLRQVTVLFVDVVGSTALGGKLEPEDIHLVMDTALARFTDIVDRHNGRVLQYAGDSLLAAFGTQEVREDDAENAVLAGLGIVAEAGLQADRVKHEHGHPGFNVRVGLHTGPVLLGGGVDAANTIRGATVNMAARMEQAAPPGTVRISAATQRLVAGQFDLLEQPPLQVKGHAEPLRTWLVARRLHGAVSAQRGVAGRQTPLIGRQDAITALQQAWQRLHASRAGGTGSAGGTGGTGGAGVTTLALVGEAGLGKSRVLGHWQAWARGQSQRALWLQAQGRPQQERVPYAMLRNLLSDVLVLPDCDTPAAARERFTASVTPWLQTEFGAAAAAAEVHVLGHLLGLNFSDSPHLRGILQQGGQIRQRALHSAAVLLAQMASQAGLPLLLCLDDVHWADDASLDFLRSLPMRGLAVAVLVLLATRPTLDERRPDGLDPAHTRTVLLPLSSVDSATLAQALLLPLQPPSPALQDLLVQRAGGNPFFMEELLQMLLDQGVLQAGAPGAAHWALKEGVLDQQALPVTLSGVLQARLGALPAAERHALQQASVLGPVFWQPTLGAIDAGALEHLPPLCRRALLQARTVTAADAPAEFAFAHVILQQVSYARLLRREKQPMHGAAARWYAALTTARAADYLGVAADHFEQAGEPRLAVRHRLLAAEDLAQRFAHLAVVEQASRGLALVEDDDRDTRWRLLLLRQRGLRLGGQPQAQAQDLQALAALATSTQNPQHLAIVALRRAVAADETGHPQEAAVLAPHALAAARTASDTALELASYAVWAGALRACGQHAQARAVATEGLARARECNDGFAESELLVAGAAIATEQGDGTASTLLLRQALRIQQDRGDRAGECVSRVNLGAAALQLGDFVGAEGHMKEALRLSRLIGNRTVELTTVINLATTRLPLLRVEEALADARAAVALAQAIRNPEYEAFSHITLGSVVLTLGDNEGACAAFTRAEDLLHGLGLQHLGIEAVAWRARAHLQAGSAQAAAQDVDAVLAHQARTGHFNGTEKPHLIRLVCCQVLLAAQDSRAAAVLRDSWQALHRDAQAIADITARNRYLDAHAHHRELRRMAQAAGLSG